MAVSPRVRAAREAERHNVRNKAGAGGRGLYSCNAPEEWDGQAFHGVWQQSRRRGTRFRARNLPSPPPPFKPDPLRSKGFAKIRYNVTARMRNFCRSAPELAPACSYGLPIARRAANLPSPCIIVDLPAN